MSDKTYNIVKIVTYAVLIVVLGIFGKGVAGECVTEAEKITLKQTETDVCSSGEAAERRIDINSADIAELDTLPDIGLKKAAAIIEMREEMYGFKTIDDLLCVDGIGVKTLEKLRPRIDVREYMKEDKN